MKKTKLTKTDLGLINHALDILRSDYEQGEEDHNVKMIKRVDKLEIKIRKMLRELEGDK